MLDVLKSKPFAFFILLRLEERKKKKNPILNLTRIPQTKAFLPKFLHQNQI